MTPGLTLAVASVPGRVRLLPPRAFAHGREVVEVGQPVAVVEGATTETVVAPVAGVMESLLVHEGEPVVKGQPVFTVRN